MQVHQTDGLPDDASTLTDTRSGDHRDDTQLTHQESIAVSDVELGQDPVVVGEPAAQAAHNKRVDVDLGIALQEGCFKQLVLCQFGIGSVL